MAKHQSPASPAPVEKQESSTSSLVKTSLTKSSALHNKLIALYQELSGEEILPQQVEKSGLTINTTVAGTNSHLTQSIQLVTKICAYLGSK